MITDLIKRLRKAADSLEALMENNPENNIIVKKQIEKNVHLNWMEGEMGLGKSHQFPSLKKFKKRWSVKPTKVKAANKKGFTYKGKPWTQRPENKDKVIEMAIRAAKTRKNKE